MKLKDKAKNRFEKWYEVEFEKRNLPYIQGFYISDLSIQWGVYQDFADSLGIEMYAEKSLCREGFVSLTDSYPCGYFNTRTEARADAINKLNERLNK